MPWSHSMFSCNPCIPIFYKEEHSEVGKDDGEFISCRIDRIILTLNGWTLGLRPIVSILAMSGIFIDWHFETVNYSIGAMNATIRLHATFNDSCHFSVVWSNRRRTINLLDVTRLIQANRNLKSERDWAPPILGSSQRPRHKTATKENFVRAWISPLPNHHGSRLHAVEISSSKQSLSFQ